MKATLPTPVSRYMAELELQVKQKVGVVPEDVLCDAREHLERDARALMQSEPGISDQQLFQHFLDTFGQPSEVAEQYEDAAKPILLQLPGYAPGWRICCTRCGRSAPAAKAGITRVGAFSKHKYIVGWCRDCRWLRWMRLVRDLDTSDLTPQLGAANTATQLRAKMHHPWLVVALILAFVMLALPLVKSAIRAMAVAAEIQAVDSTFDNMPDGWRVNRVLNVPSKQVQAIGQQLGGQVEAVSNTDISDGRRRLQINIIAGRTDQDADAIHRNLLKLKQNPAHVARRGREIFEFRCDTPEQARFAAEARYRLPILPRVTKYRVQFDAAPVAHGDPMAWNKLFNLFLQWQSGDARPQAESEIAEMSKLFQFDRTLTLKSTAQGNVPTVWKLLPQPDSSEELTERDATRFTFTALPTRAGVPFVQVDATVTTSAFAPTPAKREAGVRTLLTANRFWPVDDSRIESLAKTISSAAATDRQKVDGILAWLADRQNIRPGGETGSRYGPIQVLQQHFGNCWDYSDLFVTLCRASGVPARQILGWLHNGEGHVWSEVLIDSHWQHFDATTGIGCGSDYIPLVVSEDGTMPFVYASLVNIEVLETRY